MAAPGLPDSHSPLGVCEEFGPRLQGGLQKWKKKIDKQKAAKECFQNAAPNGHMFLKTLCKQNLILNVQETFPTKKSLVYIFQM